MISFRTLATSVSFATLFASVGGAQDLAKYRDFQFGMSLESVAKQIHLNASAAKLTHQRPAVIQTLQWDQLSNPDVSAKDRSLRSIHFDFYNDELSRMVVMYDPAGTAGLTTEDMIEAISAIYGPATNPKTTIAVSVFSQYEDNQKVLACWEDAQYSYNLFRSPYGNTFGLIAISKKLDLLASDSSREADRLDKLEAPGRELARQAKQEEDKRAAQEKARLISKPTFRP
jgi:alkylhydroperoxidase/carboxymuconolactone decarboxylase family protein YurZ